MRTYKTADLNFAKYQHNKQERGEEFWRIQGDVALNTVGGRILTENKVPQRMLGKPLTKPE